MSIMSTQQTIVSTEVRMRQMVFLLAYQVLTTTLKDASQLKRIKFLASAGLASDEIAELLGTTTNTVRVALSNLKKKGNGKKAKR